MADNPYRPPNDGRLTLPPVDRAMNRIAPRNIQPDNKGGTIQLGKRDSDKRAAGPGKLSAAEQTKILERIRKRMEKAINAESDNRRDQLDDLRMKKGDQWPSEVTAQRNLDKRPCLTVNKLPTFVHQITGDLRQNRPSITISPVGEQGDVEVAKMYGGLIRHIQRECMADIAYDTAIDSAVTAGEGYFRVLIDWQSPDSFDQVILIKRIRNRFTVYADPMAQEPDGSDMKWCFITELMTRAEFREEFPGATEMPYEQGGLGEGLKSWTGKDELRIAEHFEIKHDRRKLVELDNGHTGWEDELSEDVLAEIDAGTINVVDERESLVPKVHWYKVSGIEVLEHKEWPGNWIPILRVIGDEIDVEGKVSYSGIIRNAKGAQRMYNYWRTAETELIALAPKAPFIGEEGQFEGHEDEWKMSNVRSIPYLQYKGTSVNNTLIPPPQRQPFAGAPAGIEQAISGAAQDMMGTTGVRFDSTMNERMIDESGRAIRELRRSGDIGSFHYADNFARTLRHLGVMLIDLIPKIYSAKRMVTILREDGSEEQVWIDPHLPKGTAVQQTAEGKMQKMFNPTYGKYGVTVTIGPSYATKRIEASENMVSFAKALGPEVAMLIADIIAKEQDWPGAPEIAKRLASRLPPQLLTPDLKEISPQVQALLQAMDVQIKQLTTQLQAAMKALSDKEADRAIDQQKIEADFEARLLKIITDMETKAAKIQADADNTVLTHIRGIAENMTDVMGLLHKAQNVKPNGAIESAPPSNPEG